MTGVPPEGDRRQVATDSNFLALQEQVREIKRVVAEQDRVFNERMDRFSDMQRANQARLRTLGDAVGRLGDEMEINTAATKATAADVASQKASTAKMIGIFNDFEGTFRTFGLLTRGLMLISPFVLLIAGWLAWTKGWLTGTPGGGKP